MARVVALNAVGVHRLRPCSYFQTPTRPLAPPLIKTYGHSCRRFRGIACQTESNPTETSTSENDTNQATTTTSTDDAGFPNLPNKSLNKQIAVVSMLAAVGLFLLHRLDLGVSLKDLSAAALPYEEAISNGKPTVVEFYADWFDVCRELAPDIYSVE